MYTHVTALLLSTCPHLFLPVMNTVFIYPLYHVMDLILAESVSIVAGFGCGSAVVVSSHSFVLPLLAGDAQTIRLRVRVRVR